VLQLAASRLAVVTCRQRGQLAAPACGRRLRVQVVHAVLQLVAKCYQAFIALFHSPAIQWHKGAVNAQATCKVAARQPARAAAVRFAPPQLPPLLVAAFNLLQLFHTLNQPVSVFSKRVSCGGTRPRLQALGQPLDLLSKFRGRHSCFRSSEMSQSGAGSAQAPPHLRQGRQLTRSLPMPHNQAHPKPMQNTTASVDTWINLCCAARRLPALQLHMHGRSAPNALQFAAPCPQRPRKQLLETVAVTSHVRLLRNTLYNIQAKIQSVVSRTSDSDVLCRRRSRSLYCC